MVYLFMAIFAVLIVALDQVTKWLVVANIPLFGHVSVIDGLFHLTYTQNTGAAFSSFEGMQWLFALVFILFAAAIIWEFSGKRWPFTNFERWLIVAIYGGGVGNMIDRVAYGYVVDFIDVKFLPFWKWVFNVADSFVCVGAVLLVIIYIIEEIKNKRKNDDVKTEL